MTTDIDTAAALTSDDLHHLLRRNGYTPVGVPGGEAAVHPGLVGHHDRVATLVVLPVYGEATVIRTTYSCDRAHPSLLITSLVVRWTAPKYDVLQWLCDVHGLLPEGGEQE
jgi:hypothetical protein